MKTLTDGWNLGHKHSPDGVGNPVEKQQQNAGFY